jgi:hypothetical protein
LDIDDLSLRELQIECARALSTTAATNNNLSKFNKAAHHNSQNWYRAVLAWYVEQYGDLPSRAGPGGSVKILMDKDV